MNLIQGDTITNMLKQALANKQPCIWTEQGASHSIVVKRGLSKRQINQCLNELERKGWEVMWYTEHITIHVISVQFVIIAHTGA